MKFSPASLLFPILLFGCTRKESTDIVSSPAKAPLFTVLPVDSTGLAFVNTVTDEEKFNILTYRNFYNGGGVAIGDINNDGLPDLYLTANQGKTSSTSTEDILYLKTSPRKPA